MIWAQWYVSSWTRKTHPCNFRINKKETHMRFTCGTSLWMNNCKWAQCSARVCWPNLAIVHAKIACKDVLGINRCKFACDSMLNIMANECCRISIQDANSLKRIVFPEDFEGINLFQNNEKYSQEIIFRITSCESCELPTWWEKGNFGPPAWNWKECQKNGCWPHRENKHVPLWGHIFPGK